MIASTVIAAAQSAQRKWGIPAAITLAQYGIESGWGAHEPPGSNNGFGIKALAGQPAVTVATHEFVGGRYIVVDAAFRKFDSVAQAFDAHAELLATGRPYTAARSLLAGGITEASVNAFANALTGVYATAPTYGSALITLMADDNLYQYDQVPAPLAPTPVSVSTSLAPVSAPALSPPAPATAPPLAGATTGALPPVVDFTPDPPVQLPSQVVAQVAQLGTHWGAYLAGILGTAGFLAPSDETKVAALGGSLAVMLLSIGINAGLQFYRHQQALKALAVAKAS